MNSFHRELSLAFSRVRPRLWGICYRMTGSAPDAEDLVQETFARALERPPPDQRGSLEPSPDQRRSLEPWLVKVAVNLSRDALRHRKSSSYVGPWLPTPVPTRNGVPLGAPGAEPVGFEAMIDGKSDVSRKYELLETLSFGFLVALERLTPTQRAVLLLRDGFDYSVRETAEALDLSEANVKTTLHRARQRMAPEESKKSHAVSRAAPALAPIGRLMKALSSEDHEQVQRLLDAEIEVMNDAGGRFFAARKPIRGSGLVARFYIHLFQQRGFPEWTKPLELNGQPGLLLRYPPSSPEQPPRAALLFELNATRKVSRIWSILAPDKLEGLDWSPPSS